MALFGSLTDVPLHDLLHLISQNRLSGRLTLTRRDGHGVLVFRDGRIIYAATNAARETVGNILVHQRIISPSTLTEALMRQGQAVQERRLGSILLEMGAVDEETLVRVMRRQVGMVLEELFSWDGGFARFERFEIPARGEVAVDARDFLIGDGVATEKLLFDILGGGRARDDAEEQEDLLVAALGGEAPRSEGTAEESPEATVGRASPPSGLKDIMRDIRSPRFNGEVTLNILHFASGLLERGAIFLHASGIVRGMGQYGFGGDEMDRDADAAVRALRIPAEEPSVFHDVLERRETYVGPLVPNRWNDLVVEKLAGARPEAVAAVPLMVDDRVRLLFYGDNLPGGAPIPPLDDLELLMIQAGLAMEKSMLESRLRRYEASGSASIDGRLEQA